MQGSDTKKEPGLLENKQSRRIEDLMERYKELRRTEKRVYKKREYNDEIFEELKSLQSV